MAVTIQRELLCDVAGEVDDLLRLHYDELCRHKDRKVLAPRWDQYRALEMADMLFVVAAREGTALVGYACFFLSPHMHYSGYRVATNDVLFLHPSHRRGTTGIRLIRHCEHEARALGAHHITWHSKLDTKLSEILDRLGYASEELVQGKPL